MSKLIICVLFLVVSTVFSQNKSEIAVKQSIETFFEGFHKGDSILMNSVIYGKFPTQTTFKNKAGKDMISSGNINDLLKAIASRTPEQKWEEKILGYQIQIDGNLAHVWTPYEFWFNGKFSHCGVNSFQLFDDNGQWKIIYLVDSRRTEACKPK